MFPIDEKEEGFSTKAEKWVAEKAMHVQICNQCLGTMKPAQAISDSIADGFASPLGPFGSKRFKNEIAFKLFLHQRVKALIRHKNVR